jgi:hypothetical protein
VTIDQFIEEGSGFVDASGFRDARQSLNGRLWEKLESINAEEYPDLREAVQVISFRSWNRPKRGKPKTHCPAGWQRLPLGRVTF